MNIHPQQPHGIIPSSLINRDPPREHHPVLAHGDALVMLCSSNSM